jgi:hypothetical protein
MPDNETGYIIISEIPNLSREKKDKSAKVQRKTGKWFFSANKLGYRRDSGTRKVTEGTANDSLFV